MATIALTIMLASPCCDALAKPPAMVQVEVPSHAQWDDWAYPDDKGYSSHGPSDWERDLVEVEPGNRLMNASLSLPEPQSQGRSTPGLTARVQRTNELWKSFEENLTADDKNALFRFSTRNVTDAGVQSELGGEATSDSTKEAASAKSPAAQARKTAGGSKQKDADDERRNSTTTAATIVEGNVRKTVGGSKQKDAPTTSPTMLPTTAPVADATEPSLNPPMLPAPSPSPTTSPTMLPTTSLTTSPTTTPPMGSADGVDNSTVLLAYWDFMHCGPGRDDQNIDWCGGYTETPSCHRIVPVEKTVCRKGFAELISLRGENWDNSVYVGNCRFAFYAQYICVPFFAEASIEEQGAAAPFTGTLPPGIADNEVASTWLLAYWDGKHCGPGADDQNIDWCGGHTSSPTCKDEVEVPSEICKSQRADLASVSGSGWNEPIVIDNCRYAFYAQYQCADP